MKGGELEGELVFVARPEGAAAKEEARTEESGQARWVNKDGVVAVTLGNAGSTAAVVRAIFPDRPAGALTEGAAPAGSEATAP